MTDQNVESSNKSQECAGFCSAWGAIAASLCPQDTRSFQFLKDQYYHIKVQKGGMFLEHKSQMVFLRKIPFSLADRANNHQLFSGYSALRSGCGQFVGAFHMICRRPQVEWNHFEMLHQFHNGSELLNGRRTKKDMNSGSNLYTYSNCLLWLNLLQQLITCLYIYI